MSAEPLDLLLEKLSSGDPEAAQRVFVAYEPALRMVVRRHLPERLRAKFDSIDVVQSIWADLLHGFREAGWRFADAAHLRAFLVRVARNRLTDRLRHFHHALEREQRLADTDPDTLPPARQPPPSDVAQADDVWQKMLALCPPAHHELLRLKRLGLSYVEIAARTGMHEGSIRRILRQLARQMAAAAERPPDPEPS
jgi:RNA polymerase sigma-70 factor (ECF subfamily)